MPRIIKKCYVDKRKKDLKFIVDDKVFVKVALYRLVMSFERKDKLAHKFINPFEVLE